MVYKTTLDLSGNTIKATEFVGEDGAAIGPIEAKTEIAALTAVATADATDATSAVTLANALKVKVNAIIAALKA